MKRRNFLYFTGAAAATALLLPGCGFSTTTELDWSSIANTTTGLDPERIQAIAESAIAGDPDTAWKTKLPDINDIVWTDNGLFAKLEQDEVTQRLREFCSTQYSNGRYRLADGWVLSDLEVTLCALSSGAS